MANSMPWIVSGRLAKFSAVITMVLALALLQGAPYAFSQSTPAAITNCPFAIQLSASSLLYIQPSNINLTYAVFTTSSKPSCSLPSLSGNLIFFNTANGSVYYSQPVKINGKITNVPTVGHISLASSMPGLSSAAGGSVGVWLSLSYLRNSSTPGTASFALFAPANISLSNISVTPTPTIPGAVLQISQKVTNTGGMSASNMSLHTLITGPTGLMWDINRTISPDALAPGNETLTFSQPGLAPQNGTYNITEYITYQNVYTFNNLTTITETSGSNNATGSYNIRQLPGIGSTVLQSPPQLSLSSKMEFTQFPLINTLFQGNSTVLVIAIHNGGAVPTWTNITVPQISYGALSLSSNEIYSASGQTELVYLYFTANDNATSGTYGTALNFTVTQQGGRQSSATVYMETNILPPTSIPSALYSFSITNYSHSVVSQIKVVNPTNQTIYGAYVSSIVPQASVLNPASIATSGTDSNVSLSEGEYNIRWFIPSIPAGQSITFTYTISNATDLGAFFSQQGQLAVPAAGNSSEVKVFDINVPSFYANAIENITAGLIYTGIIPTNITVDMVTPFFVNAVQSHLSYDAQPNEVLIPRFTILPISTSGTRLFQINVHGGGPAQSFSLPVVILPQLAKASPPAPPKNFNSEIQQPLHYFEEVFAVIAILSILIYAIRSVNKRNREAKYSVGRAIKLQQIQQRIKRARPEQPGQNGA